MGSGLSALTSASQRSPDVREEPLGCEHRKPVAGTVLFQVRICLARHGWSQPPSSPGYHTARLKHASLLLLTSLSSPALKELALWGETRDSRSQVPAASCLRVAPGLWFSRTLLVAFVPAFHSKHSSIPVHTSLLAGSCVPKIQAVFQSSHTLCLWWLKPVTLSLKLHTCPSHVVFFPSVLSGVTMVETHIMWGSSVLSMNAFWKQCSLHLSTFYRISWSPRGGLLQAFLNSNEKRIFFFWIMDWKISWLARNCFSYDLIIEYISCIIAY